MRIWLTGIQRTDVVSSAYIETPARLLNRCVQKCRELCAPFPHIKCRIIKSCILNEAMCRVDQGEGGKRRQRRKQHPQCANIREELVGIFINGIFLIFSIKRDACRILKASLEGHVIDTQLGGRIQTPYRERKRGRATKWRVLHVFARAQMDSSSSGLVFCTSSSCGSSVNLTIVGGIDDPSLAIVGE